MPVVLALRRQRHEDHKFMATLGYIARPFLKKKLEKKDGEMGKRILGDQYRSQAYK
jgi:hypothetical protein